MKIKPHKERSVCRLLGARELKVYFPTIAVEPKNPRAAKERAYFPGYLFVNVDLADLGENALRWTPGTRGLVRFGGEPAVVPEGLIQELRRRLAELETIRERWPKDLKKGDRIRIVNGPFKGYEAIFDAHVSGKDRIQVLLAFLSRCVQRVKLGAEDVEKVE